MNKHQVYKRNLLQLTCFHTFLLSYQLQFCHLTSIQKNQIDCLIDYRQMGLGGDNSWGARTHDKYILPMDTTIYNLEYALIPFNKENKLQELSRVNLEH